MLDYTHVDGLSAADVARLRAAYEPLTASVRELIDATIRTEVDADAVATAKAEIDSATARLRAVQKDGSFGIQYGPDGDPMPTKDFADILRVPDPSLISGADFPRSKGYGGAWDAPVLGAARRAVGAQRARRLTSI